MSTIPQTVADGITATSRDVGGGAALARRGDLCFYFGCLICGTWVLGPIGAPVLLYGMYLLRQAQLQGVAIRPWTVTIVGGLILVDSSVNFLAWGLDLFPSHATAIGRSLWVDYGMAVDGGYALNYNTSVMGGVAVPGEKALQVFGIMLIFPIRIAAAWGFLHMKRWGLQWSIIGNWLYLGGWIAYAAQMSVDYSLRLGTSEFGVAGFWILAGIPFLGPVVMLPLLHTVNRELWD